MPIDQTLVSRLNTAMRFACLETAAITRLLGAHKSTVHRWVCGQMNPPLEVVEWLEHLAAFRVANPPPTAWRRAHKFLDQVDGQTADEEEQDDNSGRFATARTDTAAVLQPQNGRGLGRG